MTTRAGLAGIFTGILSTMLIYPLFIARPEAFLARPPAGSTLFFWIAIAVVSILMTGGGYLAGRWSGSARPLRRAALGALAGGLAGVLLFCLWGAATAGSAVWVSAIDETQSMVDLLGVIVRQTMVMFLALFLVGSGLGALGGWLTGLGRRNQAEVFDRVEPQMAMNASITAVLASLFAIAMVAIVFSQLLGFLGSQAGQAMVDRTILELPLTVSLLLLLISQFALALVIPHEARQAEHLCGMDEVKMAAFVGITTAPILVLLLFLTNVKSFSNPLVMATLLASTAMSLKSLHTLFKQILPRRITFASPRDTRQKSETIWFGSIARSRAPQLVALCVGCGLVMILPLYVTVISVLINLNDVMTGSVIIQPAPEILWNLYLSQALTATGAMVASIILLITIYLFYLNLGSWFIKRNARQQGSCL
jgi:hypothetical protein